MLPLLRPKQRRDKQRLVIFRLGRLAIKPAGHLICSLAISGLLYITLKSQAAFFASFFSGIFIDLDHILDYCVQMKMSLKIKDIYNWCVDNKCKFLFIYLHSIELLILFWAVISVFKLGIFWVAFAVGVTQHMLLDILFNQRVYSYSYFLSYRIIKRFKMERLLR